MISDHDQEEINIEEETLDELASVLVQIAYSINHNKNENGTK